jgi:protein-S-isoprenylcysteine O-methyltransferase Ste14
MARPTAQNDTMPIPADGFVAMAMAGAIVGEWLVPLTLLPTAGIFAPLTFIGLAAIAAGLALEIAAARALTAIGASTRPNGAATALVTGGVFRRSRNPFYLGMLLLVGGIMLALNLDWGMLTLPALWLALDRFVVPIEERRLESAFGPAFLAYTARTRRWL